jgi:hypothetical protein
VQRGPQAQPERERERRQAVQQRLVQRGQGQPPVRLVRERLAQPGPQEDHWRQRLRLLARLHQR